MESTAEQRQRPRDPENEIGSPQFLLSFNDDDADGLRRRRRLRLRDDVKIPLSPGVCFGAGHLDQTRHDATRRDKK